jgi:hypothetical protein
MSRFPDSIPAGFRRLLRGVGTLSTWAAGATVPFAAGFATLAPPWPPGIVPTTTIVEIVTLALVYHFLRPASFGRTKRLLLLGALALGVLSLIYLYLLSLYTFVTPTTHERFVKGFECTQDALMVFGAKCPRLSMDDLASAEYEADRLWTPSSIALVRTALVATWSAIFVVLYVILGSFLVHWASARPKLGRSGFGHLRGVKSSKELLSANTHGEAGPGQPRRTTRSKSTQS